MVRCFPARFYGEQRGCSQPKHGNAILRNNCIEVGIVLYFHLKVTDMRKRRFLKRNAGSAIIFSRKNAEKN